MQIHLKHPRHGIKVASIEDEAKWDEKHGWIRYTPDTPIEVAPVNALEVKRRRKNTEQEPSWLQPVTKSTERSDS